MAIRRLERTKQRRAVAANEALVRRLLSGFLNGRDVAVADQVLADEFMSHDPNLGDSRSSFITFFEGLFAQIPEIGFEEIAIISDGDHVWVRNDVFESEASELPFVSAVDIWRVEGEQLVEHWNVVQEHDHVVGAQHHPSVHQGSGVEDNGFETLGPWPFPEIPLTSFRGEQNGFGRVFTKRVAERQTHDWCVAAAHDLDILERDSGDEEEERVTKAKRVTMRGPGLAAYLTDQIDQLIDEGTTQADIVADLANAAEITTNTVNQILNGSLIRPPDERLEAFAGVLNVSADRLKELADEDAGGDERTVDLETNIVKRVLRGIQKLMQGEESSRSEVQSPKSGVLSSESEVEGDDGVRSDGSSISSSLLRDGSQLPVELREMMQQRDIGLTQVVDQVCREIDARDPEDWNLWHWFRDLYFDDQSQ